MTLPVLWFYASKGKPLTLFYAMQFVKYCYINGLFTIRGDFYFYSIICQLQMDVVILKDYGKRYLLPGIRHFRVD